MKKIIKAPFFVLFSRQLTDSSKTLDDDECDDMTR